jgi:hypothetical protein
VKVVLIVLCLVVVAIVGGHAVMPQQRKLPSGEALERSIGLDHSGPLQLRNGTKLVVRPGSRIVDHGDDVEILQGLVEAPAGTTVRVGRLSCLVENGRAVFERRVFVDGRPPVVRVVAETASVKLQWPRGQFELSKGERCSFLCIPGEERFTISSDEGSLVRTLEGGEYRPSGALRSGK